MRYGGMQASDIKKLRDMESALIAHKKLVGERDTKQKGGLKNIRHITILKNIFTSSEICN
jgi:hypothetical protein